MLELCNFTWLFPVIRPFRGYHFLFPVTLTLEFNPFLENFNLANNFLTMSARALIFHRCIPCDKTFHWLPLFFTLWPWPWSLIHFLKTLTLLVTFEQWVLELWFLPWVFLVIRPFWGYHYFWPCDLDLGVWPIELWYFTWVFLVIRPWSLTKYLKMLTLLITFEQLWL